ncbi:hypothetical protein HHA01_15000 [Halomonas halmophila]|uniref:Uncharacterized protein n=1 Tax=Halomonas halmophila TaxID=252 RepID=A0A4Y4EZP6_9GAMM|nr:hypothetical protein HHA01_15000 [Halomonas halmophila]
MIHKIKALHDEGQGLSICAIGQELGISRNTVASRQRRYYEPVLDMVPGVQCQVDPGELREVMIGGEPRTVYFVVFVLAYSRLS